MPTHHDYDADNTVRDEMLAAQEDERLRDYLGRIVRLVWIDWAEKQPNPKPSWLVPYDKLAEPDKEVDRQIGERLFREGIRASLPKWWPMDEAPKNGRDILVSVQDASGVHVRVAFYQPDHDRPWRTLTGQRIAPGCALGWRPMPAPKLTAAT